MIPFYCYFNSFIIYQSTFIILKIIIMNNNPNRHSQELFWENEILIQKLNLKEMNGDAMLALRVSRGHRLSDPLHTLQEEKNTQKSQILPV